MKLLGRIIGWIIAKIVQIIMYVWLLIALIFLFIGIFMIDILLKAFKIEKCYLLFTDFIAWLALIGEHLDHLKTLKIKKYNSGE